MLWTSDLFNFCVIKGLKMKDGEEPNSDTIYQLIKENGYTMEQVEIEIYGNL